MKFPGQMRFQVGILKSGSMQEALPHSSALDGAFGVQSLLHTAWSSVPVKQKGHYTLL